MLKALKSGVESEIAKYEDIIALDIKEYMLNKIPVIDMRARIQAQKEKIKKDSEANESSKLEKLILSLINLDVNEKHAEKIAKRVLNKLPNLTIAELMKEALKCINECETDKRKKNNKALNMNMLQLLINKGKKTKQSAYEALYDNGYIKTIRRIFL